MRQSSLEPERIVEAALGLIDTHGLESFSTRKLGTVLGVEAMALYHYFPSKGDLLDAVADRVLAEIHVPDPSYGEPIPWLRTTVYRYRAVARAHPNAFLLMAARRFNTPHALGFLEQVLAQLQSAGLSPVRAARYFRMIGYFLHGALLAELTVLGQRPDPTGSTVDSGMALPYPAIAQSAPYLGASYLDATFHEGLELILTALAQELTEVSL